MTRLTNLFTTFGAIALLISTVTSGLAAQCDPEWQPVGGAEGTNDKVNASIVWDSDGPGPADSQLVVGGRFTTAGGNPTPFVATYDRASGEWRPVGEPPLDVHGFAALPNGQLFAMCGLAAAFQIVSWDGDSWLSIGQTTPGSIEAMAAHPNGDLIVGGNFTTIGGIAANQVARWDGTNWSPMGTGFTGPPPQYSSVFALTVLANGDVVAGGNFTTTSGGNPSDYVARWDGLNWLPLGSGPGDEVNSMTTLATGELIATGRFGSPANGVAIWDGTSWSFDGAVALGTARKVTTNGPDIFVAGEFSTFGGTPAQNVAHWNGSVWTAMGAGITHSFSFDIDTLTALPNGDVFAGGNFGTAGGQPVNNCATWDGNDWVTTTSGISTSDVHVTATLANGALVAGGSFTTAVTTPADRVAQWNGSEWEALGSGVDDDVYAMLALPNGDLIVGGLFTTAGGVPANRIALWDGTAWSAMGSGMNEEVTSLTLTPNGEIIAGGNFTTAGGTTVNRIASWNGSSWQPLGNGLNAKVFALTTLANGDIVAGGQFTNASGTFASGIARWDGASWNTLGSGMNNLVRSVHQRPNGDLIASGNFTTAGGIAAQGIARWDGISWHTMASGMIGAFGANGHALSMTDAPGGDLIAVGTFFVVDGLDTGNAARWNGTTWSALGEDTAFSITPGPIPYMTSVTTTPDGRIVVAGPFREFNDIPSQGLSILASPCPATAGASATGCVGSGGVNELSAQQLPWIGGSYSAIATGMPIDSLAIELFGFAPISTPLASLLPQAAAGCDLLTTVDGIAVHLTTTGTVQTELPIPDDPALVGGMLYQQVVPLELDAGGNIVEITATNRLDVVIGAF